MHGWRAVTLMGAVLAVALTFPGIAAAAPSCDPSLALGNVHIGDSVHGTLTCDDPSGTGLNYFVTTDGTRGSGSADGTGGVDYTAGTTSVGADSFTVEVDDNEGGST